KNSCPMSWMDEMTEPSLPNSHTYYALCYCTLILAIVFGNIMVCLAVLRERTLQTTTNYLVVSLAVADLLVATLVMPWVVYLEVTGGVWNFSRVCCDIFVTMDVMMCTASILNLCAISIDRYTAVVMPVHYQHGTGKSSCRRVSIMILIVWMLAFAVSCPLLFGFNTTGDPRVCSISNPNFVIYSSVVSFYLPFIVTLLLYVRIYFVLRRRQRKRSLSRRGSLLPALVPKGNKSSPESRLTCGLVNCIVHASFLILLWIPPFQEHKGRKTLPHEHQEPLSSHLQLKSPGQELSPEKKLLTPSDLARALEVHKLSNGKILTSLKLVQQQARAVQLRERKATQMLAIVLGTFIICWLPFFMTHILNSHCQACHVTRELYSATTWLGYVNSALNPIIYTTFNIEFRKAFLKLLCCC
uniref:D(3) dopamine receptor n=1 Tax=Pelusios castaneus TaxID=367368 RepID=A0A8C8RAR6_9SAUR